MTKSFKSFKTKNNQDVSIQNLDSKDIPDMCKCICFCSLRVDSNEITPDSYDNEIDSPRSTKYYTEVFQNKKNMVFGAFLEDELVSFLVVEDKQGLTLTSFYTLSKNSRVGIGRNLLSFAENECFKTGSNVLFLDHPLQDELNGTYKDYMQVGHVFLKHLSADEFIDFDENNLLKNQLKNALSKAI